MKKIFYILTGSLLLFFQGDLLAQNFVNGGNNLSATGRLGTTSKQSLAFITGNTERARITNSGKFGIGTRSPVTGFHVNGVSSFGKNVTTSNATRVLNLADDNAVMRILRVHPTFAPAVELISRTSADGANVAYWDFYAEPSDASFRIRDRIGGVNRDRVTISRNGNVGIGTTSPSAKLQVDGTGSFFVDSKDDFGVYANSIDGTGVHGSGANYGISGLSDYGAGVRGESSYGPGVQGWTYDSYGGDFVSSVGTGLIASGGTYAAEFIGNTYTSGTAYQSSDKNLKTNIQEFGDAMSIINKLKPQNYEFKNEAKYASLHLPKGRHYGLLAQDLEQVLPNLVSEAPHELKTVKPVTALKPTADGRPARVIAEPKEPKERINIKAVNYIELIPIIVKAMQEQQGQYQQLIADLQNQVNDLKSLISRSANGTTSFIKGHLKQNTPNPAVNNTVISYYTSDDTRNAQILVTDMKGSVLKAFNLARGAGQVNIKSGELAAGTYNYTLYVNNSKIETKQMIIAR